MKAERTLKDMATLFLALGDGTRLRVLNLMRHGDICVSAFTDVLGQSQPKVSRHLAYLRNAGLVEARRDGKWMHYSLAAGLDDKTRLLLHELFKWMEDQAALQKDTDRYAETGHQTSFQAFLPLLPEPAPTAVHSSKPRKQRPPPDSWR
jgi:ArsR family transcriptional regulator, arsenate/arsenite/antimonite-responsive transcriptional repressor